MSPQHGVVGTINVRNATLRNACVNVDCLWHTCHWGNLYENGCYMLTDISGCCNGTRNGFTLCNRENIEKFVGISQEVTE